MRRFQNPSFENVSLEDLADTVADFKQRDFTFVQICATTLEDSCDVLYAFVDPETSDGSMTGIMVNVPDGAHVPSITEWYPAAFVFENETHDLFGIKIDGINIDFGGEFYKVSLTYPMNPRAAELENADAGERTDEEGVDNE